MATRKGIIELARGDLIVRAHFETERLEPREIEDWPEIARWDAEADRPVVRERHVKEGHEELEGETALPSGTVGFRYVTEDGEEVPKDRVTFVQVKPDGEVAAVKKRPSTVLKDQVVPVEKWVAREDVEQFLTDETYEVWGQEAEDEAELQELAEYIEESGEAPMFVWMLQPTLYKTWGIMVPQFDEDAEEFSLFVKTTRKRIEPEHEMPLMEQAEVEDLVTDSESQYVEQEAPG